MGLAAFSGAYRIIVCPNKDRESPEKDKFCDIARSSNSAQSDTLLDFWKILTCTFCDIARSPTPHRVTHFKICGKFLYVDSAQYPGTARSIPELIFLIDACISKNI